MERYMSVKDVMQVLPLGKTKVVELINSLPHINTGGKLMIRQGEFEAYLRRQTVVGTQQEPTPTPTKAQRREWIEMGLTEDGLIPYRKARKGA